MNGELNVRAMDRALADVRLERWEQFRKWGVQEHDLMTWSAILTEETGEFAQAALHAKFGGPKAEEIRKEAIQTAAVAVQIVEMIDLAAAKAAKEGAAQ